MNDGRAISTCSLGPLISAEVAAADSLQENGLVKYKGNAELSGLFRPALGTVVTFEYTMDGVTRQIPKRMRVLSAFANPFTRTTSVELGCLLTYKSDVREPERIDTELANRDYTGGLVWSNMPTLQAAFPDSWGNERVDGGYWVNGYRRAGASFSAKWVMRYCLEKLGITASSIPLTNTFRQQEFDFSDGWVQIISDLLQSEGYVGELDYNDELQVRTLTDDTATGPVIFRSDLQNVSPINVGDIPASALGVEYTVWRFNTTPQPSESSFRVAFRSPNTYQDDPPANSASSVNDSETTIDPLQEQGGWEWSQQIGPQTFTVVKYETRAGQEQTYTASHVPESITKTQFGLVGLPPNQKRVPIRTTTIKQTSVAAEANDYVAAWLKAGSNRDGPLQSKDEVTYEYNNVTGEKIAETRRKWESMIAVAGSTNIDFYWPGTDASGGGPLSVSSALMQTEEVRVEYFAAGNGESQITTRWQTWMHTQPGQQAAAAANKKTKTRQKASEYLDQVLSSGLYLIGQETEIRGSDRPVQQQKDRTSGQRQEQRIPGPTDISNSKLSGSGYTLQTLPPDASSAPTEESVNTVWIYGEANEERRKTLSMPYNDDDQVLPVGLGPNWVIIRSTAQEKALRYGRIQNRLTYGYRNGMEIQMNPAKMPDHAFAPLYISIDGLVAQYRVNNPSWVLTAGEAVASCNAIYWGVVGTT